MPSTPCRRRLVASGCDGRPQSLFSSPSVRSMQRVAGPDRFIRTLRISSLFEAKRPDAGLGVLLPATLEGANTGDVITRSPTTSLSTRSMSYTSIRMPSPGNGGKGSRASLTHIRWLQPSTKRAFKGPEVLSGKSPICPSSRLSAPGSVIRCDAFYKLGARLNSHQLPNRALTTNVSIRSIQAGSDQRLQRSRDDWRNTVPVRRPKLRRSPQRPRDPIQARSGERSGCRPYWALDPGS